MNAEIAAELRRVKARIAAFAISAPVAEPDAPKKLQRISDKDVRSAKRFVRSSFQPKRHAGYKMHSDT